MAKKDKNTQDVIAAEEALTVALPIENLIYTIREQQVIFDMDLADLYGVETKRLNEQVKRNMERFPEDFMFQLSQEEVWDIRSQIENKNKYSYAEIIEDELNPRSQIATLDLPIAIQNRDNSIKLRSRQAFWVESNGKNIKYLPYAFTENGVAMLSSVLRSPQAIQVNISIMRAFVAIRKSIMAGDLKLNRTDSRLGNIESHLVAVQSHIALHDKQFDEVFKRLEEKEEHPTQGIYYEGQIFDAYTFVCDRIKEAKQEVILIDNYIDESVLVMLDKREPGVAATVYTMNRFAAVQQDVAKHNAQYPAITLLKATNVHDRFLITDNTVYLIGASLKDLGKKLFGFSRLETLTPTQLLQHIK